MLPGHYYLLRDQLALHSKGSKHVIKALVLFDSLLYPIVAASCIWSAPKTAMVLWVLMALNLCKPGKF
jgi:hypothetical protein